MNKTQKELGENYLLLVCKKESDSRSELPSSLPKGNLYIPRKSVSKLLCHL